MQAGKKNKFERHHWILLLVVTLIVLLLLFFGNYTPAQVPAKDELILQYAVMRDGVRHFPFVAEGVYPDISVGVNGVEVKVMCGQTVHYLPSPPVNAIGKQACPELFSAQGVAIILVNSSDEHNEIVPVDAEMQILEGGEWTHEYGGVVEVWRAIVRLEPHAGAKYPEITIE